MENKNKLYAGLFLLIVITIAGILPWVSAVDCSIPPIKQGTTIQLTQLCSNCTEVNLTRVNYPNNTIALLGEFTMTKNGSNFNYTWGDTNTLGGYSYTVCGDYNGVNTCQTCSFEVTPSGQSGNAAIIFSLFMILILYAGSVISYRDGNGWMTVLFGMALIALGVYMIRFGVVLYRDWLTNYFAYITIGWGVISSVIATIIIMDSK